MIEIGSGFISVLYSDGTSAVFDPGELRIRIEKSFLSSGTPDLWIAGELVLAVEFALRGRHGGDLNSVIHADEIDDCVVRILEDAGFSNAAAEFRRQKVTSGELGKLTVDDVEGYLLEKLKLPPENEPKLAGHVIQALKQIGVSRCSPRLVLELARYFREEAAISIPVPSISTYQQVQKTVLPEEKTPPVWRVRRSDAIFPSMRAEIDLKTLFQDCTLTPPLTEFSLTPKFIPVIEEMDRECQRLQHGRGNTEYPLLLTLKGFTEFASKWLCYESVSDPVIQGKRIRKFTEYLQTLLRVKPFKIYIH